MKVLDLVQGSEEWLQARLGSIGGSAIGPITAEGGKTRKTLLYRFAGEILSGEKYDGFKNSHMERGIEMEPEAREAYELITGREVKQTGMFLYGPHKHYSPDGDMGDGIIEIKSVIPSTHVETIILNRVPPEYIKQIQWGLHEREWCDFISYCPAVSDMPIWIKRVYQDPGRIWELNILADKFIEEMLAMVEKVRNFG